MSETLRLKVVTPEGSRLDEEVAAVTARSENGEFCILPDHRPILASLLAGRFLVERSGGETEIFVVDRGFFEGGPDHVNVITQRCVTLDDLDQGSLESEASGLIKEMDDLSDADPRREDLSLSLDWVNAQLESFSRN